MSHVFVNLGPLGMASPPGAGSGLLLGLSPVGVVAAGAGAAIFMLFSIFMIKNFLYLCRPNKILIFTGRKRVYDGVDHGPLVITGKGKENQPPQFAGGGRGRAWRIPIIERVDRMSVSTISTDIAVQNAYSRGNIPLQIHAIANVKVHTNPDLIRNAIERFLGREQQEIRLVAQQTLEGALREVLAQMTPEEVNEDRLQFAEHLMKAARDDLDKLGLQLDTLKIQNVSDATGYLDSLGRPKIAAALRDAENAENQAKQETTEAQAEAHRRAETSKAESETAVLRRRNELTRVNAELDGKARAVEEEASAAAQTARAEAEKELQEVRKRLENLRLQAEVVIPAEVQRQAEAIRAKGDAAPTVENGIAVVEVLEVTAKAWKSMGEQAREIYVIQHLDEIVKTVVSKMENISVGEVSVLDPGDGSGLANYAAAYPQTVAAILEALSRTTGIDVPAILNAGNERAARRNGQPPKPSGSAKPSPTTPQPFGGLR